VPPLARLFHFAKLGPLDVLLCFCAGAVSISWFEIMKWARRRRLSRAAMNVPVLAVSR